MEVDAVLPAGPLEAEAAVALKLDCLSETEKEELLDCAE